MQWLWEQLKKYWEHSPALTLLVAFSIVCLFISLTGLIADPRFIHGERAWIKPCKFSISLAIYGLTLFWFSQFITQSRILFKQLCVAASTGTIVELSAIITQVIRGTTSHFNTSDNLNHAIFWLITAAIIPVAIAIVGLFVLLFREKHLPPVLGLSLKWGVFLTVIGLIPGILMILPDRVQETITAYQHFNGHTIGFADGGPGIPWLGWSTIAGDLRIAHFAGIHALQILPLAGSLISKKCKSMPQFKQQLLIWNGGFLYLGFITLLTVQALSAESIVTPSMHTMSAAAFLLTLSTCALLCTFSLPAPKPNSDLTLFTDEPA